MTDNLVHSLVHNIDRFADLAYYGLIAYGAVQAVGSVLAVVVTIFVLRQIMRPRGRRNKW
jgi:hypothetical protein